MSEDSKPASKGHWTDKIKDENAALKAELAALRGGTVVTTAPQPARIVAAGVYDEANDPIAWIGPETDHVHLVSSTYILAGHMVATPGGSKSDDVVPGLKAHAQADWTNNPFRLVGTSEADTKNLKVQYSAFHQMRADRFYAEEFFSKKYSPFPRKALIASEDFTGYDFRGNPTGRSSPCSTDALREYVRWALQRYAGKLWLDKAWHPEVVHSMPNPYGKGREKFGVDPSTIRHAGPDGVLTDSWGGVR